VIIKTLEWLFGSSLIKEKKGSIATMAAIRKIDCFICLLLINIYRVQSCNFPKWKCDEMEEKFRETGTLSRNQFICSPNGEYQFGMDRRGRLSLCSDKIVGGRIWTADTPSARRRKRRNRSAQLLPNGDFILLQVEINNEGEETERVETTVWSTDTGGNPGAQLVVENDGYLYVKYMGTIIWMHATQHPSLMPTITTKPSSTPSKIPTLSPTSSKRPSGSPTYFTPTKPPTKFPTNTPTTNSPTVFSPEFTLYITGDTPYDISQFKALQKQVPSIPLDAEAFVHLGDIKRGGEDCSVAKFTSIRDVLIESPVPGLILPGDNDVNDCPEFSVGWERWKQTFGSLTESNWDTLHWNGGIQRSPGSANFAFAYKQVLVVGIDIVGGPPHNPTEWRNRHAFNLDWVSSNVQQYIGPGKASVLLLLGHARPTHEHKDFFPELYIKLSSELGLDMNRVLYVHGNGHEPETHSKYGFNCVQVDQGAQSWMKLKIKPARQQIFEYSHVMIAGSPSRSFLKTYDES